MDPEVNYYPISETPVSSGSEIQPNTPATPAQAINIISTANGSMLNGGTIQSSNFVSGESGWQIDSNGNASFMSISANGSPVTNQDSYGSGADGDVTISADTSLSSDMYYANLVIQTGVTLNSNGYRILVSGTTTFQGTGKIAVNGGTGGNGANYGVGVAIGGTAGAAAHSSGSLPATLAGQVGGNGGDNPTDPTAGGNGVNAAKCVGAAGVTGGKGGDYTGPGGGSGAAGGTAGAKTGTVFNSIKNFTAAYNFFDVLPSLAQFTGSASSGGGGGGGWNGGFGIKGGAGGGSGAPGGILWFASRKIVTVNGNNYLEAKGGNGGSGGNGNHTSVDGGGGGGGSGGVIIEIYSSKTGSGTVSVAGGTKGTAPGTGGVDGTDGNSGTYISLKI